MSYRELILADGPFAYFRFNETDRKFPVKDEVPGGPVGTYRSGATPDAPGALVDEGTAAYLTEGFIPIPGDAFDFGPGQSFTIELWLKLGPPTGALSFVLAKDTWGAEARVGYCLTIEPDGSPRFRVAGEPSGPSDSGAAEVGGRPLSQEQFRHVAIVFDGVTMTLHIDGEDVAFGDFHGKPIHIDRDFTLGASDGGNSKPYFTGALDEVAVYDKALTKDQIGKRARFWSDDMP